jgi:LysR family transcriptional regulator, low CO2-responsive transcriptional regulator
LKNKQFSPVAGAFLDYINKEKTNIIKKNFTWAEVYK